MGFKFNTLLRAILAGGGAPAWTPNRLIGSAFTVAQIAPGLSGSYDTATNANRIYLSAPNGSNLPGGSIWSGWINGTGATLAVPNGAPTGAVSVSVDGGAYATATNVSTTYTLFTGLSDTPHFCSVRIGSAYGTNNAYLDKLGGNVLNITGASPYIDLPSVWAIAANTNSIFSATGAGIANLANFTPAYTKSTAGAGVNGQPSDASSVILRGNFQNLVVSLNAVSSYTVYVSVDGAAPSTYASIGAADNAYAMKIPATAGVHTYYIWTSLKGSIFSAAGDSTTAAAMTGITQMHQFGDSITYGITQRGNVEVFSVASAIGYAAVTLGISGLTIAGMDTDISTWLAATTVTSSDVAILAIGRNNTGGSFDGAETAGYTSILNKLIAKGYGKILVRGILPAGDRSTTWTTENASIQSCIATVNDPKLIFVDTSACPVYSTESNDLTHPNTAGYVTIGAYLLPKYRTALGL